MPGDGADELLAPVVLADGGPHGGGGPGSVIAATVAGSEGACAETEISAQHRKREQVAKASVLAVMLYLCVL